MRFALKIAQMNWWLIILSIFMTSFCLSDYYLYCFLLFFFFFFFYQTAFHLSQSTCGEPQSSLSLSPHLICRKVFCKINSLLFLQTGLKTSDMGLCNKLSICDIFSIVTFTVTFCKSLRVYGTSVRDIQYMIDTELLVLVLMISRCGANKDVCTHFFCVRDLVHFNTANRNIVYV